MKTITATDANRQFSALLREARQGEVFQVISRGKPVATIGPAPSTFPERHAARKALWARLRGQDTISVQSWTRDELYDETAP
jgi:prevent-host-death family protein